MNLVLGRSRARSNRTIPDTILEVVGTTQTLAILSATASKVCELVPIAVVALVLALSQIERSQLEYSVRALTTQARSAGMSSCAETPKTLKALRAPRIEMYDRILANVVRKMIIENMVEVEAYREISLQKVSPGKTSSSSFRCFVTRDVLPKDQRKGGRVVGAV